MGVDLWELARAKVAEKEASKASRADDDTEGRINVEVTTVFCGAKGSGKSTMLSRLLDRNEASKATTALEYFYARRIVNNTKQLGHIWDLGGGTRLANLLEVPITPSNIATTGIMFFLDLSKPHEFKTTYENIFPVLKGQVEKALHGLNSSSPTAYDAFIAEKKKRLAQVEELAACSPFPIPLVIVGTKYDEFQNLETDERRKICKMLRFLSLFHCATLVFYSSRMETTMAKGRVVFSNLLTSSHMNRSSQLDLNKPLFVPIGADSFTDIGLPSTSSTSLSGLTSKNPLDMWWSAFSETFPPMENKLDKIVDPSRDNLFAEPSVDAFIDQKKKELEMYWKQKKERQAAEERAAEKLKAQT